MLAAALKTGKFLWLVIFAVICAAISVYYYFRVIIAMYFKQGNPELNAPITATDKTLLVITCILVLAIGIVPQLLLTFI